MKRPSAHSGEEERLFEAVVAGDSMALGRLYSRHADMVYGIAFRMTESAADAKDVLQDVFVGLPDALRSFDGRGSFEGWLKKVTVRNSLMKLRARRRRREVPLAGMATTMRTRDATVIVERLALERALAALPAQLRIVFVLKEIEGFTHGEIADLLQIKRGTSEVRLHRARKALRNALGKSP